jgi:hypothetical protein
VGRIETTAGRSIRWHIRTDERGQPVSSKKRVDTLRILVDSHSTLSGSPRLTAITGEFTRIQGAGRVAKHNGWLLSVVYTTRALDTTLSEVLAHKGWRGSANSLGKYLAVLRTKGIVQQVEFDRFKSTITDQRNKYMHSAGAMPSQLEADKLLSEMQACLAAILGRL